MALDKLVDSSMLDGALANTADAIREKTGDFSSDILFDYNTVTNAGFADAIGEIVTLEEGTANDTATSGDIRYGKTAHAQGQLVNGSMPDADFANTATSGKTYTDISSTAPVLVAGDYLYINEGYTPYSKISLAKLVPDGSDVKGHGEYILSGHSAYDNDGTLVAGTIPTLKSTDVSVSGKTVTIPVGKYTGSSGATAITKSVADGSYTVNVAEKGVTTTPAVTGSTSGTVTDISSTSKPSGTDGTDFWTITPSGSVTTTGVAYATGRAVISQSGYIAEGNKTSEASTFNITPRVDDGTNRYIAKGTVTSGTATISSISVSAGSSASTFDLSGSADVSAPTVGTDGYVSSTKGTKNANSGGATLSATVDKIVGTASISATTKKPSITKQDVPSGVTQAASGDATTTAPSSGVYVAVKSAANTATLTPTVSITASGYGTSSKHGITASGATVGAAASDTTYVPITTVSGSIGGSATGGSAKASISNVNSMNTITNISGKTAGTDYWTVKATATGTAGGYTPTYTVSTAGWIGSTVTGTKQTVSVTGDSSGQSIYIPRAVITGSSTNATATTTVAPGTVSITRQSVPSGVTNASTGSPTTTAPTSGVYVAVKATAAANSTGTISAITGSGTATVSTDGYAPTTLTGSITVSGTATAKTSAKDSLVTYYPINTASPTFKGGAVSGTATASSSTGATLSTTENNSGITIAAAGSATRAVVQYNSAVSGWVSKAASENAYAASSATALTGTTYYLNGATLGTPTSNTYTFNVNSPDGTGNHDYLFTADTNGKTTIQIDDDLTMQWNATDESLDFVFA